MKPSERSRSDIVCLFSYRSRVPTVLRRGPFRFFFFSNEGKEEPHIHVQREDMIAKIWLEPPRMASAGRFSKVEMREIERIVRKEQERLLRACHEFFNG
jgi:hypothetical protein